MLHEVANGEVGGIALTTIAELFTNTQRIIVWHLQRLDAVTHAAQCGPDEHVLRPCEATAKQRGGGAVGFDEILRIGVTPVLDRFGVQAQAGTLLRLELAKLLLDVGVR